MDLIPRASLPNKETHEMEPKHSDELNRQVHELLHKGLIQESESMCCTSNVSTKEEWRIEDVHRFLHYQQDHNQI